MMIEVGLLKSVPFSCSYNLSHKNSMCSSSSSSCTGSLNVKISLSFASDWSKCEMHYCYRYRRLNDTILIMMFLLQRPARVYCNMLLAIFYHQQPLIPSPLFQKKCNRNHRHHQSRIQFFIPSPSMFLSEALEYDIFK